MCGIVGAAARREVSEILLEGLRRLEYRGYDSAGIALVDNERNLLLHKHAGKLATSLSFYYLRANKKLSLEPGTLEEAQSRVRVVARNIIKEQAFQPHEGTWCTTCDYVEFCPAKKQRPKPVPVTQRAMQIPFDFG